MNRTSFLKALATIVVAPAVISYEPIKKGLEFEKEWWCMRLLVPTEMYENDSIALEHFLFAEMKHHKINPKKPYILYHGFESDNFTRNLATIIIKQETKYLLSS